MGTLHSCIFLFLYPFIFVSLHHCIFVSSYFCISVCLHCYIFVSVYFSFLYFCNFVSLTLRIFVSISFVSLHRCIFVSLLFGLCIFLFLYLCAFGLYNRCLNCLYMEAGSVVFLIYYEMAHLGKCIRVRTECTICVHIICSLFHQLFAEKRIHLEANIHFKPYHLNCVLSDTFT